MAPGLVRLRPHHVPRRRHPLHRYRRKLHREVAVSQRLLDMVLGVSMHDVVDLVLGVELAVGVDAAGEGLGEPVQGDGVENVVGGGPRAGVGPAEELVADPGELGDWGGGENEANGCGAAAVEVSVCGTVGGEGVEALDALGFDLAGAGRGCALGMSHQAEVKVDGFAGLVERQGAAGVGADVASLRDIAVDGRLFGAEADHELVDDASDAFGIEVLVRWWAAGKSISWQ